VRWLLPLLLVAFLLGCRGTKREEGTVLRFALTNPGERMRDSFHAAIRQFEREHPGVRVELIEMDDDVYQKMGLLTLFVGGTPPDVYFQWGGHLVRKYAAAGYAMDLSAEFPEAQQSRYYPSTWASCRGGDGKIYLWPDSASVTTVMWYRKSVFREAGIEPPTTWQELLATCARLKARGIIPIAVGNRELWAGGNFAAAILAQFAGAERYNAVLGLRSGTRLDDPAFVQGLEVVTDLQRRGFLNQGVNGVGTDEARALLEQRRAAMHPIGDWMVSEAEEADVEDLAAFRLPVMPGQQGDRTLLALSTGYMVNPGGRHTAEAVALVKHLGSEVVQREFTQHGHVSALRSAAPGADAPEGQRQILELLSSSKGTALAPDIGFDQEVSDAFLDAIGLALGGKISAAQALGDAERQVRALRRSGAVGAAAHE
jgi:ABC-type glycerol-3-phosphate transport system substrate-binding protein